MIFSGNKITNLLLHDETTTMKAMERTLSAADWMLLLFTHTHLKLQLQKYCSWLALLVVDKTAGNYSENRTSNLGSSLESSVDKGVCSVVWFFWCNLHLLGTNTPSRFCLINRRLYSWLTCIWYVNECAWLSEYCKRPPSSVGIELKRWLTYSRYQTFAL